MLTHLHIRETHLERVRARVASEEEHELRFLQVARRQTLLQVGDIKEGTAKCLERGLTYWLKTEDLARDDSAKFCEDV